MFKNSRIPLWVNILLMVLVAFMTLQIYMFYFDHGSLSAAGITTEGDPNLNIIYTTAGRLAAMVAATAFVLVTQNPQQQLVVLFMSILREGQEMFIDPLFPYGNSPAPPAVDFGMHVVIVALEVLAFVAVYRVVRQDRVPLAGNDSHS